MVFAVVWAFIGLWAAFTDGQLLAWMDKVSSVIAAVFAVAAVSGAAGLVRETDTEFQHSGPDYRRPGPARVKAEPAAPPQRYHAAAERDPVTSRENRRPADRVTADPPVTTPERRPPVPDPVVPELVVLDPVQPSWMEDLGLDRLRSANSAGTIPQRPAPPTTPGPTDNRTSEQPAFLLDGEPPQPSPSDIDNLREALRKMKVQPAAQPLLNAGKRKPPGYHRRTAATTRPSARNTFNRGQAGSAGSTRYAAEPALTYQPAYPEPMYQAPMYQAPMYPAPMYPAAYYPPAYPVPMYPPHNAMPSLSDHYPITCATFAVCMANQFAYPSLLWAWGRFTLMQDWLRGPDHLEAQALMFYAAQPPF
jgi:hypothetical protein